jgi:hypothetical protein
VRFLWLAPLFVSLPTFASFQDEALDCFQALDWPQRHLIGGARPAQNLASLSRAISEEAFMVRDGNEMIFLTPRGTYSATVRGIRGMRDSSQNRCLRLVGGEVISHDVFFDVRPREGELFPFNASRTPFGTDSRLGCESYQRVEPVPVFNARIRRALRRSLIASAQNTVDDLSRYGSLGPGAPSRPSPSEFRRLIQSHCMSPELTLSSAERDALGGILGEIRRRYAPREAESRPRVRGSESSKGH